MMALMKYKQRLLLFDDETRERDVNNVLNGPHVAYIIYSFFCWFLSQRNMRVL